MAFDGISINTLIGTGSFIKGDVRIDGMVRLDGDLEGRLETPERVYIGSESRVKGDIVAKSVVVCGVVQGDVIAPEGVKIESSGMVIGNILTTKVVVDNDVILHGKCFAIDNREIFEQELEKYKSMRAISQRLYT